MTGAEDLTRLSDMLAAFARIRDYTADGRAVFMDSPLIQDAVIRNLQIAGEAAKALPPGFARAHPDIPWQELIDLRDRLTHRYRDPDRPALWRFIDQRLPALERRIAALAVADVAGTGAAPAAKPRP